MKCRRTVWARRVECTVECIDRVAIIRLAEKRPLGRTRDRRENKSPHEHEKIRSEFVEWTDLAQHTKK